MSKDKIVSAYRSICKSEYLTGKSLPKDRKVAVFGCSPNNIGASILDNINGSMGFSHDEFDLNDIDQIYSFDWSKYDTFVFNQGVCSLNWIEDYAPSEINNIINTNLTSNIHCLSRLVCETINRPYIKTVIFIGSMGYNKPLSGSVPYTASKAGLEMFVRNSAFELASKGFRIFLINPSAVQDTPMTKQILKELQEFKGISESEAIEYWKNDCLFEEYLTKKEIAEIVRFLMTNHAQYLSGSPINLSGGQR